MVKKILIIVTMTVLVISFSCSNGLTEPELQPGRRDYVWSRDTLRADKLGFQFLCGIWGTSPNDVWVVGDAATYVNKVWHYDGNKWKNYLLDQFATPIQIHGVSSSEIWMVTTISDIWKYNGTKWSKDTTIVPNGYKRILFEDIYGYKNNLYAVGIAEKADGDYTGIIVHFNGSRWRILNTPQIKEYFINVMFLEKGDILIYSQNYLESQEPSRLYTIKKDSNLTLIRKSSSGIFLSILNNKMYVAVDREIFEYTGGSLKAVIDLKGTDYAGGLVGRTIKDFFTANHGWYLGHYNGNDIINIYPASGNIVNAAIFEKEVFIICYTLDNLNYILHGKLD